MTWQGSAEVFACKKLGEHYHVLTIVAPEVAKNAQPGQFVAIQLPQDRSLLLRRPFSIHRVDRRPGWAGAIEVVFDIRGRGTELLAEAKQHAQINVIGPLGRPFRPPKEAGTPVLLIGGGIGTAPLQFLAEELSDAGHEVTMLIGGRTGEHLLRPIEAKRAAENVEFTTEDGSVGHKGRVTDVLDALVERLGTKVIYTCGPTPMLRAIASHAKKLKLPCQIAWEEVMACGFGACLVCAVPVKLEKGTRNTDAKWAWARCCSEGPVFSASRIHWDMVGVTGVGSHE